MSEKASCERQIEERRNAASMMRSALPQRKRHKSQATKSSYKSQFANHCSPITTTNHAFLIDIWRLETAATRWKHTMRVHPNRHGSGTSPITDFAATNVVSAPRRVLASRFSALGAPSLWRNPRVHREHPPGGGIVMLIPMHRSSCTVLAISTRNACLKSFETRKAKLERRGTATLSPNFEFRISVDRNLRGET